MDFLISEADEENASVQEEEDRDITPTVSDNEFIDDADFDDILAADYAAFENVTRHYNDSINDALSDFDYEQEPNNYCNHDDETELSINEFENYKEKIESFKKTLVNPQGENNLDSFFYSILYAIRFYLNEKSDSCENDDEIKTDIGVELFEDLNQIKENLRLDLDIISFENQCFEINRILTKNKMFLKVYELKEKFHALIQQCPDKKNVIRDISSCIREKFNGFNIVRVEFEKQIRQKMSPIAIIYKPVRKETENIDCYFSKKINYAFRTSFSENDKIRHGTAFQCHYCSTYYGRKDKFDRHIENCAGQPGFVYNFNTQSLVTFEENLKFKRDIPFTAYIDFETTVPTDDCLDPEKNKMIAVSYVIIFAFQPDLNLNRIIIERSFGHSQARLLSLNYLSSEQLKYADVTQIKQLRDCALSVAAARNNLSVSEMFSTEIKFASECLLNWFNAKFKKENLQLSNERKKKYEIEQPINWEKDRCCLCTFPIGINPTMSTTTKETMSYTDFIIFKECKFLKNIFLKEELEKTNSLKNLELFHNIFSKFLKICIYLHDAINQYQEFSDCAFVELIDFLKEYCSDFDDFEEVKEKISDVQIKNKKNTCKVAKFTLQLYAFVYQKLFDFPKKFDYETLTTSNLFEYVHKIINVKIHLHHSHITGKIIGYAHDFCNSKVRENNDNISCIAHNFFGFDMYFLIKGIRVSVWRTKDINIGGTGLTSINYANFGQMKFIDTMKYFLSSLGKLAETLDSTEKERVENLTIQFLSNHPYFSNVWKQLSIFQKNRILEIIVSGKGVIPYEKILTKDSLSIKPEDGIFFTKDEFFSTLKGEGVDNESYENSKQLFILLKMRNLSYLNDLYNAQDVILLLEMMENRFQTMQDTTGYNPRIINSASKLSGCIQREQSKVIIALPTNNIQMEVFEKTLSGGYSCVNNRLSFDTEILMPNLRESDYKKMNLDQSFKAFKRDDLKVIYSLRNNENRKFEKKRVISKILKFDENNQYGFAMTKPMPTGCIKQQNSPPSWLEFNLLIETFSLDDKIGHLFLVDIEFDEKNATEKQFLYNEIFPPVIEKDKTIEANERSIYQLLELYSETFDGKP